MFTFVLIMDSIINNQKSSTSMKKLFALLVVAGMVFASCGGSNTQENVNADATEPAQVEEQAVVEEQPAAEMPETAEEAPVAEEVPAE